MRRLEKDSAFQVVLTSEAKLETKSKQVPY